MIVAFASQRGGVGKTSLCTGMAAQWAAHTLPLQVLDLDPQQIALKFAPALEPLGIGVAFPDLEELRDGGRAALPGLTLLDTPPTIGNEVALAVSLADVVVVPLVGRPSLTGAEALNETLQEAQAHNDALRVFFAFTMQKSHTIHYQEVQQEARATLGPRLLESMISESVVWDEAMGRFCPVEQLAPGHPAAQELRRMAVELWEKMNGTAN